MPASPSRITTSPRAADSRTAFAASVSSVSAENERNCHTCARIGAANEGVLVMTRGSQKRPPGPSSDIVRADWEAGREHRAGVEWTVDEFVLVGEIERTLQFG